MPHIAHKVDYSGRQVDIELLQSIPRPVDEQEVSVSSTLAGGPKIVTGIEKLVQRYTSLLLQNLGDVTFDQLQGSELLKIIRSGVLVSEGHVGRVFALASVQVLRQLNADNADTATFGTIPQDEQLQYARLIDVDIDYGQSRLMLKVKLESKAGTDITYIVPVTAAR